MIIYRSYLDKILFSPTLAVLKLRLQGHHVVLLSSGAVGKGLQWMSCTKIPEQPSKLQAYSHKSSRALLGKLTNKCLGPSSNWPVPTNEHMERAL